jgi:hypothetical protein
VAVEQGSETSDVIQEKCYRDAKGTPMDCCNGVKLGVTEKFGKSKNII